MGEDSPITPGSVINHANEGRVRFGAFELDLQAGELRKGGVKIKLHGQPFEVLAMLLERPGEVVPREALQKKLWASDTFVDFEHGLNKAINKLREALGDDADVPRYIETLPRRGYRFVGTTTQLEPFSVTAKEEKKEEPAPKTSSRRLWAVSFGSVALCTLLVAAYFRLRSPLLPPRVVSYRQLTSDRQLKGWTCIIRSSRLVTDGARVFFAEENSSVMQVSSRGGDVVKISTPFDCFSMFGISPDKTELLGASRPRSGYEDDPLWVLSIVSGLARRVGDLHGHAAAWSPDGQRIVYATGGWSDNAANDVYIAAKDGSEARRLAHIQSGIVLQLIWSPDGKVVRMEVWGHDSNSVWEVSSDGTNLHRLQLLPGRDRATPHGNWTPGGRYFVFAAANPDSGGTSIWALRETRSVFDKKINRPSQLTSGAMNFWAPVPSPDGKQIFAIGGLTRGQLERYDSKLKRLEPYLSGISAEQLDFSRNGKWVTYVTFPEGTLWRSKVGGSERMQLTTAPLRAFMPQWSPDGTRIAFSGELPGEYSKIYVVSADGGTPEVVSQGQEHEVGPTWTPDGNSLIFGGSYVSAQAHISSLDLRTGRVSIIPGSQGMYSPRISPDGRFIVSGDTPGNRKLSLFDLQAQKWSELENHVIPGPAWPQWSSDGKYVYLSVTSSRREVNLFRIRIADCKLERIAAVDVPDGMTGGSWGAWIGFAPDGSALLLRDLSLQEIYALDVDLP